MSHAKTAKAAPWVTSGPAEAGRHPLDEITDSHAGDAARVRAIPPGEDDAPGPRRAGLFRARPDHHSDGFAPRGH